MVECESVMQICGYYGTYADLWTKTSRSSELFDKLHKIIEMSTDLIDYIGIWTNVVNNT